MPLRAYLMAIAIFANAVKGKSMLALSRDLGTQYKTAFVLAHKMREAMGSEVSTFEIGGDGKSAAIDGGYCGGYVKPANKRENRRDRRLRENRSGKRKVVVVIRERGEALPGVFRSEAEALAFIRANVLPKPRCMRTRQRHGMPCTPGSNCTGSTIKRRTALAARRRFIPIRPRASSAGCAGARLDTITTSPART